MAAPFMPSTPPDGPTRSPPRRQRSASVAVVGHGTCIPPIDRRNPVLSGKTTHGCPEDDAVPATFIPWPLELHRAGRLPIDPLMRAYPYAEIGTALADHHAGAVVKPVILR